ncbi:hypothetical protein J4442_02650 [Candidatus Woesearchaeota archaeon]|nr:hypothetical protein [Candidatus Woesearchaeota archaeon]
MKQINLKLPDNLLKAANNYVENFGFRNIQELATESIREKVFEKNEYDETFSEKEVELIEKLLEVSIKKGKLVSEEEVMKVLRE